MPATVRFLLVQLLGFSECPEAIPTVLHALDDPSSIVRAEACRSLADLKARDALPQLRLRMKDPEAEVRRAASEAVSTLSRH